MDSNMVNVGTNLLVPTLSNFENYYKSAILLQSIYKQSIIDLDNFYKTCAQISYRTSNSQREIENMPFYVFNNFMVYLSEIIDAENEANNGDGNNSKDGAQKTANSYMSKAKSMVPNMSSNFRPPNFKTPKI